MIRKPLLLALSALAVTGLVAAEGVTAGAAPRASATALGRWGGQQAVERLGSRLPSVAAANHLRTAELRNNLLTDPTLYVDGSDTLLYVEPALVGPTVAGELMLTGRFIHAPRALATGLVSEVVPDDQLEAVGQTYVDDLLAASPMGLRMTKEGLNLAIDAPSLEAEIGRAHV